MSRTIITISDSSKESVTEKKEFSKEQVEKALDLWLESIVRYFESGYNVDLTVSEEDRTVIAVFTKPEEETVRFKLEAFDD